MEGADLTPGADIAGEYTLERPLSRGGMGAVYLATQKSTGRKRALKLMHPSLVGDATARERFEREAKIGALIASDHIVEVLGAGVDPRSNTPWLAMELLEGQDLGHRLLHGALSAGETAGILRQLCHALAAAHAVGVVHRDLKPENVFLSQPKSAGGEVVVKVLDFGIAKIAADSGAPSTAFIGTPVFMAPEQSNGEPVGPYTDVWALGLLTYQLLTGFSYWRTGNSPATAPMQVLTESGGSMLDPASVRAKEYGAADRLPPGFDAWFERAVNRDRTRRFADAGQAWHALAPLLGAVSDLAIADTLPASVPMLANKTPPVQSDAPSPRLLATIGAVGLSFAGVMFFITTRPHPPDNPLENPQLVFDVPIGNSPVRGPRDAPITIVEFADFECPFSREAEKDIQTATAKYGDRIKVVWKDFPLNFHPHAQKAAALAREARREQGDDGFWKMHDALFGSQPKLDDDTFRALASAQGLDPARVDEVLGSNAIDAQDDLHLADRVGIDSVPTFFINGHPSGGAHGLTNELDHFSDSHAPVTVGPLQRPHRQLPPPPRGALETGTPGPGVVELYHFCNYSNFFCVLTEPPIRQLVKKYEGKVHYVFWYTADPDADAAPDCAAVTAAANAHWQLHDLIGTRQAAEAWARFNAPPQLDAGTLDQWAQEAGADMGAYKYELRDATKDVHRIFDEARDLHVTVGDLYVDGALYPSSTPSWELELALQKALEARQGT